MKRKRWDIKAILADPVLRRELIVASIVVAQAREGIITTMDQAEAAYDKVQKEQHETISIPRHHGKQE